MRIVDLETKSLNPGPRPPTTSRRLESRIEELTSQLTQTSKESSRMHVSTDKALLEAERQRARLEDEVKNYESKIVNMRQTMDQLVRILCYSYHLRLTLSPANFGEQPPAGEAPGRARGRRLQAEGARARARARTAAGTLGASVEHAAGLACELAAETMRRT